MTAPGCILLTIFVPAGALVNLSTTYHLTQCWLFTHCYISLGFQGLHWEYKKWNPGTQQLSRTGSCLGNWCPGTLLIKFQNLKKWGLWTQEVWKRGSSQDNWDEKTQIFAWMQTCGFSADIHILLIPKETGNISQNGCQALGPGLTHLPLLLYIYVSESGQHWFK